MRRRWPASRRRSITISARLQHAAFDLVEFDALEQRFEVALAEAFIAFALNELEEDRPDRVFAEDLQQQALTFTRRTVDEDAALTEFFDGFAMTRQALVDVGNHRVTGTEHEAQQEIGRLRFAGRTGFTSRSWSRWLPHGP